MAAYPGWTKVGDGARRSWVAGLWLVLTLSPTGSWVVACNVYSYGRPYLLAVTAAGALERAEPYF